MTIVTAALCLAGCAGEDFSQTEGMNVVRMTGGLKYEPAEITVKAGEAVRWKNESLVTHTVTADPSKARRANDASLPPGAKPFNSGDISSGGTFEYTFTVPGTYRYFCIPHESMGMVGVVIVKPAASAAGPSERPRNMPGPMPPPGRIVRPTGP